MLFRFKQFAVRHDKCAMKVGSDGVLLGAWATIPDSAAAVLDVGTGTGLIALMIAQRCPTAFIDAIDIDADACVQAAENASQSPFRDRINIVCQSFLEYATDKKYDLVVSNPPYFAKSLKSPDPRRNAARHNDSLPLDAMIKHARRMLAADGAIALILPAQASDELELIAAVNRLYVVRRTAVAPSEGTPPKRILAELSPKISATIIQDTLALATKDRRQTEQYAKLVYDFYL